MVDLSLSRRCAGLILLCHIAFVPALHFKGGNGSYAAMLPWQICARTTLSFNFRTTIASALLLYQDDGGGTDYLQLSLVQSTIILRLKFTKGRVLKFSVGRDLNDGQWHTVAIAHNHRTTTLTVDKVSQKWTVYFEDLLFGHSQRNRSELYVGGMPLELEGNLQSLSNPTAFYIRRYVGEITGLSYTNCTGEGEWITPSVLHSHSLLTDGVRCSDTENRCTNNSVCEGQKQVECDDCDITESSGPPCEYGSRDRIVTFSGSEYIYYNFSSEQSLSYTKERIYIEFKTSVSEGLLFYTGDGTYFINIGLVNGTVYISTYMGKTREAKVKYPVGRNSRLDDSHWHSINISREANKISVDIDNGKSNTKWSLTASFSSFKSRVLYLGGAADVRELKGSKSRQNYFGCLRNVVFTADDSVRLNLLTLAYQNSSLLSQNGILKHGGCFPVSVLPAVTILSRHDYLTLPSLSDTRNAFISLNFKTTAADGLLLYNYGTDGDTFAVELLNGHIYLILTQSKVTVRKRLGVRKLNNGLSHSLIITFRVWGAAIMMDSVPKTITVGTDVESLKLTGPLYLAGVDYNYGTPLNPSVYTASLRKGFVGCVDHVKVDGLLQNLQILAEDQKVKVARNCTASVDSSTCTAQSCITIKNDSTSAQFNGEQYFLVKMSRQTITLAEEIVLQFKTRFAFGSLIVTQNKGNTDSLAVFLYNTNLVVRYNISRFSVTINAGGGLNDDSWHTLRMKRLAEHIQIQVDNKTAYEETIGRDRATSQRELQLHISMIWLASAMLRSNTTHPVYPVIGQVSTIPGFIGHIRTFIFNGVDYIGRARGQFQEPRIKDADIGYNCLLTNTGLGPLNIVTINRKRIPVQMSFQSHFTSLTLQFKTNHHSGLILYAATDTRYIGLELITGQLRLLYGHKNNTHKMSSENRIMHDNKWHYVTLTQLANDVVNIQIDDKSYTAYQIDSLRSFSASHFSIGEIDFGYMELPPAMLAPYGYIGCIGSLEINGFRPNLAEYIPVYSNDPSEIQEGCQLAGDVISCSDSVCNHGGLCTEPDLNEIACSCDMTTYTGATCSQEGESFTFGESTQRHPRKGGVVSYTFSTLKDTHTDWLAFKISTNQQRANILRVSSATSKDDMLAIGLRQGKIFVKYNIGSGYLRAGYGHQIISDGKDHIVRFWRQGSTDTTQVDNMKNITNQNPAEEEERLRVFNGISKIEMGGYYTDSPFIGTLTGLTFDGTEIFKEMPADSTQLEIDGNVWNSRNPRQPEATSKKTSAVTTAEEIVVSSSGVGPCDASAESDCDTDMSTDDLVFVKVTTMSTKRVVTSPMRTTLAATIRNSNDYFTTSSMTYTNSTVSSTTASFNISTSLPFYSNKSVIKYRPPSLDTELTTDAVSLFDLSKNIPLVAGISGAALLTFILIAIIACRLTRKPSAEAKKLSKHSASQNGAMISHPDYDKSINSNGTNLLDTPNRYSSEHQPSNPKEWYV